MFEIFNYSVVNKSIFHCIFLAYQIGIVAILGIIIYFILGRMELIQKNRYTKTKISHIKLEIFIRRMVFLFETLSKSGFSLIALVRTY